MLLKVGTGGPPAGTYNAKFVGVKETTHEKWGPGLQFQWEILGGPLAGKIASRTTGTTPTQKNGCGKMLVALAGRPIIAGEEFDPQTYVGQAFMIVVAETDSGGTRVETAIQAPALQ